MSQTAAVPETLAFDRYLDVVAEAGAALATNAAEAGLHAPVPTCPGWTMADLVAHQGMVHRWASGKLRLEGTEAPSKTQILEQVPAQDLLGWFTAGVDQLLESLAAAAPDLDATVFLPDAPPPRQFWARRQAHETTIHAADAFAAVVGRMPRADEVLTAQDVAVDGIDELLTGFFTRGRAKLADGEPFTVSVTPTDTDRAWTLHVAEGRLTTQRRHEPDSDVTFSGTADQLYLGLWNRGDEIVAQGRADVLDRWRAGQRVRWS